MADQDSVIPFDRLPTGFAETVKEIPEVPVPTRPAATILLLRDGDGGVETLMLRRTRRSGFVPGAWVFAGGRVDAADGEPEAAERMEGLNDEDAARRLRLPLDADPPAIGYYAAALREAFEETGILVGYRAEDERPVPSAGVDPAVGEIRDLLLADEIDFGEALDRLGARIDATAIEYVAHWITPVQEPRRYDTRFFAAMVEPDTDFALSPSEMSDGRWMTPEKALELHAAGEFPMVFPTIRTLEDVSGYAYVEDLLGSFGALTIPAILPRLVVTPTGVGLEMD